MKLHSLFEVDIVDLDTRRKSPERKFSSSDQSLLADQTFAKTLRSFMNQNLEHIQPVDTPPLIKEMKSYPARSIMKIIKPKVDQFIKERGLEPAVDRWRLNAFNEVSPENKRIVYIQAYAVTKPHLQHKLAPKIQEIVRIKIAESATETFGSRVEKTAPTVMGVRLYLNQTVNAKPSVQDVITAIFKKYRLAGLGFFFTDKLKSGYRTKVEGIEIPDPATYRLIERDMKNTFGSLFVKMKTDGEITNIGHRFVASGMTNFRFFFTSDLLKTYRK